MAIDLDWMAYWQEFQRIHGEPVLVDDRWLFEDGWQYGKSYDGPEFQAPKDETLLKALQRKYWHQRRFMVKKEHDELKFDHAQLEQMQYARSAPIMVSVRTEDGVEAKPLDLEAIQSRIAWLAEEQERCERKEQALGRSGPDDSQPAG